MKRQLDDQQRTNHMIMQELREMRAGSKRPVSEAPSPLDPRMLDFSTPGSLVNHTGDILPMQPRGLAVEPLQAIRTSTVRDPRFTPGSSTQNPTPAFSWTKRIPARTDTEEKINKLLAIPIADRTFRFTPSEVVEDSADSSAGMSTGSHEVASEFALSDLKGLLAMGSVVKSEDVKQLENKPSASKPRIPATRSKTTSSKKRKITEPIDLDLFENMEIPEILNKMQTFLTLGMDKIVTALVDSEKKSEEAQEKIADLVRLGEMRMAYSNKVDQELALLKQEVAKMKQESEGAKVKHQQELATLVEKAKRSAAVSILQSRLEMVEEASKEGFVSKTWDSKAWSATLQSLTGEKINKVVKDVAKAAVDDATKVDKEITGEKKTAGDMQDDDGCAAKA